MNLVHIKFENRIIIKNLLELSNSSKFSTGLLAGPAGAAAVRLGRPAVKAIMCGIVAIVLANPALNVAQLLLDGMTALQHRGQDAAGIVTCQGRRMALRKDSGLVKDVFEQGHMDRLLGNSG